MSKIRENCADSNEDVTCTFQLTSVWGESTTQETFKCKYLMFDVCYGYHGCECSNGYVMATQTMQFNSALNGGAPVSQG